MEKEQLIEILQDNEHNITAGDWDAVYENIDRYERGEFSTFLLENDIDLSTLFKNEIPEWAFAHCKSLTSINILNNVTEIGRYAFSWCSSLTSITIPNSVKEIGDDAFGGGYLLVKFDGTQEEWLDIKFKDDWHQGGADNIVFLK